MGDWLREAEGLAKRRAVAPPLRAPGRGCPVPLFTRKKGPDTFDSCGFTLIELLVVISIVVLLMGLLLPVLSRARKQARAVVCRSTMRQWGIIASMYRTEHEGRLMGGLFPWYFGENPDHYFANEKLYLCPAATRCDMTGYNEGTYSSNRGTESAAWWACISVPFSPQSRILGFFRSSYGTNQYADDLSDDPQFTVSGPQSGEAAQKRAFLAKHWTRANVKGAAGIPLFFDCAWGGPSPWETDQPPAYRGDCVHRKPTRMWEHWHDTIKDVCIDRHGSGSINMAFADGSARRVGLKELWTLKWHVRYNRAGPWTQAGGVMPGDWPHWMRRFKEY